MVYIQEAHPTDGWQLGINEEEDVLYAQPTNDDEREHAAHACSLGLDLKMPTLIDDMENSTDLAYAALPDRLYLVGVDGTIVFRGEQGPFGFRPEELDAAISGYLDPS